WKRPSAKAGPIASNTSSAAATDNRGKPGHGQATLHRSRDGSSFRPVHAHWRGTRPGNRAAQQDRPPWGPSRGGQERPPTRPAGSGQWRPARGDDDRVATDRGAPDRRPARLHHAVPVVRRTGPADVPSWGYLAV